MIIAGRQTGLDLLEQLTQAAGWRGDRARLAEAVPHMSARLAPDDYIETLRNLGLAVTVLNGRARRLAARLGDGG